MRKEYNDRTNVPIVNGPTDVNGNPIRQLTVPCKECENTKNILVTWDHD